MTGEEARQWAAQAWCSDANKNTVMDVHLAESFAEILEQRVNEAVRAAEFGKARRTMARHLREDDGLMIGYVANIAMLLHDRYGITDHALRNKAASEIMNLIFGLKDN